MDQLSRGIDFIGPCCQMRLGVRRKRPIKTIRHFTRWTSLVDNEVTKKDKNKIKNK